MGFSKIGVGIVGASTLNPGWATFAHIPALRVLPDYELRAVSTSNKKSAAAAAEALGVEAFDNHEALIAHPGIDLVVVTVKVPLHHQIVSAALGAGKMVFSEWPLGNGWDEAEDLARQARGTGQPTLIGLQGRSSPGIRYLRDLVAEGYIGDILATTLVASGSAWGPVTDHGHAYLFDVANGATLQSVSTLHALDAIAFILGDFATIAARSAVRRSTVTLMEDGTTLPVTSPDHLSIAATLRSGAIASVFYRGGTSRGDNLRWEINGSRGDLVITAEPDLELGEMPGNIQVDDLIIRCARDDEQELRDVPIPPAYFSLATNMIPGVARNVGFTYAQFAHDLRYGTSIAPDFDHALKTHRLMKALQTAAETGVAQSLAH